MAAEVATTRISRFNASHNPFRVTGTELPPNVLLMAKILAICFLLTGHWRAFPDHFVPFLPIFDQLGQPEMFRLALQVIFFIAAFSLLFNFHVRAASLALGLLLAVAILSSRPFFENNRAYTACLWILAGLQDSFRPAILLRYQVILLYFGAGLNKLLDADWRSGQFFETMTVSIGHQPLYIRISSVFPHLFLSKVMSWTVIILEFILPAGFVLNRYVGLLVWLGAAYHTVLLLLVHTTFGMFYYATLASFLAFVDWPLPALVLSSSSRAGERIWRIFARFDLDHLFKFDFHEVSFQGAGRNHGESAIASLYLSAGGRVYAGLSALYMALVYNPLTYLVFAILLSLPVPSNSPFRAGCAIILVLFLSPALLVPKALERPQT